MQFKYKPITNYKQIGRKRAHGAIRFIVIHDTGNPGKGAGAMAHYRYLQGATRAGSAHYYVDDKEIIQTIGDSRVAWAVGDTWARKNRTRSDVTNYNSVSIELCINSDSDKAAAYKNMLELTKNLMRKFNIPADRVVRHFDASGKPCPGSWQANKWAKWWQFKADIKKPIEWQIDLSKSSEFGAAKAAGKTKEMKGENLMEKRDINKVSPWAEKEWKEATEAGITDGTRPGAVATREEVAAMILRGMKCKCAGGND